MNLFADDKFHDECGVFAVAGHREAAGLTYLGLYGLQHRGQESAGIVSSDGVRLHQKLGMGYVAEVFDEVSLNALPGTMSVGHVRYSTTGESRLANAQPILTETWRGPIALAHNGNLLETARIRAGLEKEGAVFQGTTDTEVMLHLLAKQPHREMSLALQEVLNQVAGAFSLVLATVDSVWAGRDPYGVRPLCLGKLDGAWVISSETCAFDLINASYVRDIRPGELLRIKDGELTSVQLRPVTQRAHCVFEHVYFSRPDSRIFEQYVHSTRQAMGQILARESPVEADLVVPVPDSGVTAALGYSEESGIPFKFGLIRNHYVGRTFIEPTQSIRHFGVKIKLNPVRELLEGRRVVLLDDSIVRGTTSKKIVDMVRQAGAREVHVRISSPPTVAPCHYGINTPTYKELIANERTLDEIRRYVEADTLHYLSLEGLQQAVSDQGHYCMACFSQDYPIRVDGGASQRNLFQLESG